MPEFSGNALLNKALFWEVSGGKRSVSVRQDAYKKDTLIMSTLTFPPTEILGYDPVMPRNSWTPKNRYCRDTNLTEEEFQAIAFSFVTGFTATETHKMMREEGGYDISRQTIATHFVRIGDYLYNLHWRPMILELIRESNPGLNWSNEQIEKHVEEEFWKSMQGEINYEEYRNHDFFYPDERIRILLAERRRKFRGLQREAFKSHLGFVIYRWYVDRIIKDPSVHFKKIAENQPIDEVSIETGAFTGFMEQLAQNPM